MVFVKFYNMNKKKISNVAFKLKLKSFHFTSQNNIAITVQKCSVFFSSFFSIYVLSILLKMLVLSFFFFLYAVFNNVQVSFLFFSFFSIFIVL